MKKTLTLIIALMVAVAAVGQVKILERSSKKAPDWVKGSAEGYLVSAVQAPSIAEARPLVEQDISAQVAMAIARNVRATVTSESTQTNTDDHITYTEEFASRNAIQAANLPFLKGISLSKAEDIYWVKVQDKGTKKIYYEYYVKYPFSAGTQAELVRQFEKYDREREAELNALEAGIGTVDSVDGINAAIGSLKSLDQYFFDAVRKEKVTSLISRYQALFKQVVMTGTFIDANTLVVSLNLNGHHFRANGSHKATSNCATDIQVLPTKEGTFRITFNSGYCVEDEENYIELTTNVGSNRLTGKYMIPKPGEAPEAGSMKFIPVGTIQLDANEVDVQNRTLTDITVRISFDYRGGEPVTVNSLELFVPTLRMPVVIDNIDREISASGTVVLKELYKGTIAATDRRKSSVRLINGTVTVTNPASGTTERIKIALPYSSNWE